MNNKKDDFVEGTREENVPNQYT